MPGTELNRIANRKIEVPGTELNRIANRKIAVPGTELNRIANRKIAVPGTRSKSRIAREIVCFYCWGILDIIHCAKIRHDLMFSRIGHE